MFKHLTFELPSYTVIFVGIGDARAWYSIVSTRVGEGDGVSIVRTIEVIELECCA